MVMNGKDHVNGIRWCLMQQLNKIVAYSWHKNYDLDALAVNP